MEAEWKDLIHCTEFTGRQKIYQTKRNNVILFKKETKKKNSALLTLQGMCVE